MKSIFKRLFILGMLVSLMLGNVVLAEDEDFPRIKSVVCYEINK